MAALIHARRLRHALDLIDQLPRSSRLTAAVMDDDELIRDMPLPEPDPDDPGGPDLREWDQTVEMLASVYDAINALIAVTIQVNSEKKRPFPKPLPRPQTAVDRERSRRRQQAQAEILAIFAPGR